MEKRRNTMFDQRCEDNYFYNGQLRTSCRTRIVIIFQQQLGFYIEKPKGQSSSSGESDKSSDPVTTRSDKPACGGPMQTDPDKPASGNCDSANKDEMDKEDPTQGIPDWLQPFSDNLVDLETHVPAHSSERENSDSEGAANR